MSASPSRNLRTPMMIHLQMDQPRRTTDLRPKMDPLSHGLLVKPREQRDRKEQRCARYARSPSRERAQSKAHKARVKHINKSKRQSQWCGRCNKCFKNPGRLQRHSRGTTKPASISAGAMDVTKISRTQEVEKHNKT